MAQNGLTRPREVRPLRADARRNRERVLVAAREAFAVEGPGATLDDIARRAGVGAGTVPRHFPTKDELLVAVLAERLQGLADAVGALVDAEDPGPAFFAFFRRVTEDARQKEGASAGASRHFPVRRDDGGVTGGCKELRSH